MSNCKVLAEIVNRAYQTTFHIPNRSQLIRDTIKSFDNGKQIIDTKEFNPLKNPTTIPYKTWLCFPPQEIRNNVANALFFRRMKDDKSPDLVAIGQYFHAASLWHFIIHGLDQNISHLSAPNLIQADMTSPNTGYIIVPSTFPLNTLFIPNQ